MATSIFLIWYSMGVAFLIKRNLFKLAWLLYKEEAKESVEGCYFVLILDHLKGEKLKAVWGCGTYGPNSQILIYMYSFGLVKKSIIEMSMSMVDFVYL